MQRYHGYAAGVLYCTGLEIAAIAGLAASAAGTGTQIVAGNEERSAMNAAVQNDLNQQQGFQKQGQALAAANEQKSTPVAAAQSIDQGTQSALGQYAQANAIPLTSNATGGVGAASNPTSIVGQNATAHTNLANQQAAPLQGYNDWQVQQWINNLQTNTGLNQLGNFSQQVNGLLPLQEQAAQNSQSGLAGFGSLLNSIGGLVSTGAAAGGAFSPTPAAATGYATNPNLSLNQYMNQLSNPVWLGGAPTGGNTAYNFATGAPGMSF